MATRKVNTNDDGQVVADPPTPTIAPGDPAPDTANLTDSEPDAPGKTTNLTSPWGSKVTVAADDRQMYLDAGYSK
jgi:hypothetical protein